MKPNKQTPASGRHSGIARSFTCGARTPRCWSRCFMGYRQPQVACQQHRRYLHDDQPEATRLS
eukprot:CAMPEP_0183331522 /NCGR_PEP_ID=MMETSP0164_2-20130417/892_1 /TAXON_ID=221442 /ORGANISM="Coccolithus pelagicus ssp braarudi, Strain PLY182g" /LENGTH=62 /DNA_ID=CAMNT_0025500025 /DNA_START=300 /DNA_END=485 /DNA_ORIENTATION=-